MKMPVVRNLLPSVCTSIVLLTIFGSAAARADALAQCGNLATTALSPPGDATALVIDSTSLIPADQGVPEHCLVYGHLDTEINFAAELPTAWNGKILMVGNSGFAGDLGLDLDSPLVNGYATVGTDTGHNGGPDTFLGHPDRVRNFEGRAVHLVALTAKQVVKSYYKKPPVHAYFQGCSRGGTQGMVEADRYPGDFDGIIAGASNLPSGGSRLWNVRAMFPKGPSSGVMPGDKLALLKDLILAQCDALDGITDGLIESPHACHFSPTRDLPRCGNDVDGPSCFTKAQVSALEKMHRGPSVKGWSIGPKFYFSGMEGYSYGDIFGVGSPIYDMSYYLSGFPGIPSLYPDLFGIGIPSFDYALEDGNLKYLVFGDPKYQVENFNFDKVSDVARYITVLNRQLATDPDLSEFGRRGGKLLQWHGEGDTLNSYNATREFYDAGVRQSGGYSRVRSYNRLFLVPGTSHCGGGAGPWDFNPLPVLEQWVEKKKAPDAIVANVPDTGSTRPVCAYPSVARLVNPVADINVPESYRCVMEPGHDRD